MSRATHGKPFITRGSGSSGGGSLSGGTYTGAQDFSGATVTLPSGIVIPSGAVLTTQAAGDNSTKGASTAYADAIGDIRDATPLPGVLAETFDRRGGAASGASAGATGVCVAQLIYLRKGMVISNLSTMVGVTVAATSTHFWQALTDVNRVMVACTADDTTSGAGMVANTLRTQAIATIASGASATYTVPASGWYYHFVNNTATTVFTPINANTGSAALYGLAPIVAGTSETISTGPPSFAKTFGAITAVAKIMYCAVS